MNAFLNAMGAASSGMNAQTMRMRIVSENVANTDTPGYRAKTITFDNAFDRHTRVNKVEVDRISLSDKPLGEAYDPGHPMADARGYVKTSNVNVMMEMADSREARRSYEANLASFQQARQMYSSLLDLLRS
ncbi:MAG: flagellar basal body rod protein FlgC [Pseudomonadota bacterium]